MLVSIIIPCYNSERYLVQCLKSVTSQTYLKLEIIVIDDGSTDQTSVIVKRINDERIKYFYKKNGGLSSARNYGIEKSTGECIAFLDSDDYWRSDKIEKQLFLLDKYDVIYSDYSAVNLNGDPISNKAMINPLAPNYDIKKALLSNNVVSGSGSGVLIKKEIPNKIGFFNINLKIGEDWDYWARIAWSDYTFGYINEELVSIRFNTSSMQHTTSTFIWGESIELLLTSFLFFKNITNKERAIIYKRLFINAYNLKRSFKYLVKYYIKSIKNNSFLIFDAQILSMFCKYYPRIIVHYLFFLKNKTWYK